MIDFKLQVDKILHGTLLIDGIILAVVGIQYLGFPASAGLSLYPYLFFAYLLFIFAFLSFLGGIFFRKKAASILNCFTLPFFSLLYFFLFLFLNGPFNILVAVLTIVMLLLNAFSFAVNVTLMSSKRTREIHCGAKGFMNHVDMKRVYPRAKVAAFFIVGIVTCVFGIGSFFNWNAVITVKAPDEFKTTSSYWGPPSLHLQNATVNTTALDNSTLMISNETISIPQDHFINGALAYITSVHAHGDNSTNYCDYSGGAESYPNGTVFLSSLLPETENITVTFYYVFNYKVLQYLNISQSTLIMNFHSSSHPQYPNGYWYYNDEFFESVERTYLLQLLDYWDVKYYLNVHNGIDFPHVFNYLETVPLCYTMIDWIVHQQERGLCTGFQGISPDFESGKYDKLWWDNYTSSAEPLFPGSLLPDIVSDNEWFDLNSQNMSLYHEATEAWEEVYDYAESLGFSSYIVFQGGAMRDVIDGDYDVSRLPTFPTSDNPTVRYGLMSYQDAQDDVEGGRYQQYRDCVDQIAIYGDRGRSILTGWIANGTSWYTDDALGLGRYIEDILVCQAAGMNEIFHAPIYRMQGKWGDEAILLVHQALNEWKKQEIKITVPAWEYRNDYMDAIKNLNHWWLFMPLIGVISVKIVLFGMFSSRKTEQPSRSQKIS